MQYTASQTISITFHWHFDQIKRFNGSVMWMNQYGPLHMHVVVDHRLLDYQCDFLRYMFIDQHHVSANTPSQTCISTCVVESVNHFCHDKRFISCSNWSVCELLKRLAFFFPQTCRVLGTKHHIRSWAWAIRSSRISRTNHLTEQSEMTPCAPPQMNSLVGSGNNLSASIFSSLL